MKLSMKVLASALTALTFVAVPACDDKKEDKKGDKKDAKKEDKKDEKAADGGDAKADAKADGGDAKADAKADGGDAKADAKADGGDVKADVKADGGDAAAEIGVAVCDDYVKKYTKCIEDKLPEKLRDNTRKALASAVEHWKKAAATEEGKKGLVDACNKASDAVKSSCGW